MSIAKIKPSLIFLGKGVGASNCSNLNFSAYRYEAFSFITQNIKSLLELETLSNLRTVNIILLLFFFPKYLPLFWLWSLKKDW